MGLEQDILSIYAAGDTGDHFHPYIGSAFLRPTSNDLRVVTVGINAYAGSDIRSADGRVDPDRFRDWFEHTPYRYQKKVVRDTSKLVAAFTQHGKRFAHLTFSARECCLHTNAIKRYLPIETGKRAAQVDSALYEQSLPKWHNELKALAEHGVFPHAILIFGKPFWGYAWSTFRKWMAPSERWPLATHFEPARGTAHHWANLISVRVRDADHTFLLLRLRHPSGRSTIGGPVWLSEQTGFREFIDVAP